MLSFSIVYLLIRKSFTKFDFISCQANLTASTWGAIRSPPTAGQSAADLPFSPTLSCEDDDSSNEEPVLSGFGAVSKDCSVSGL
jgi:hypothetical protein